MGLIPGWVAKIPHAAWHSQKKKRKKSTGNCPGSSVAKILHSQYRGPGFDPGGAAEKNPPVNARDARDVGLIPGQGSKILHALLCCQKNPQKTKRKTKTNSFTGHHESNSPGSSQELDSCEPRV